MKKFSQPFVTAVGNSAVTTCCWSSKATFVEERLHEALNWSMEAFVISNREILNGKTKRLHHFNGWAKDISLVFNMTALSG
jgi:hypothetical protein